MLPGVKLTDILARLGDDDKSVFAHAGVSSDSWGNVLGWNPASIYKPAHARVEDISSEIEIFAEEQRSKGRLLIGYLSYDFGAMMHGVPLKSDDDIKTPLALLASFDNWITFDESGAHIHSRSTQYIATVKDILLRPARNLPMKPYSTLLHPTQSRSDYRRAFKKVKQYIEDGDVYQINFTHRLEGKTDSNARDLFCSLSSSSQSDFQAYIEGDDFEILSLSPERFIRVTKGYIETLPIKGTRPRGNTTKEDEVNRKDLLNNPKDAAELNMITDLMRNDLGAISEVSSVSVEAIREMRRYPTLWHANSKITGKLIHDVSPIAALISVLPGGSITGCPKKRSMEIIDELEVKRRNIYYGSIFSIKPNGDLDSNTAIRTILKKDKNVYLSVGGGIVYDSTEGGEYQESLDKAKSFMPAYIHETKLSSDILEQQFGPTEVKILYQDNNRRIISTKVIASKQILELSEVKFMQKGIDAYPEIHRAVVGGKSMGKAFRNQGIAFTRQTNVATEKVLSSSFNTKFRSNGASTIVDVSIFVGASRVPYAQILETYSPDVVWTEKKTMPTKKLLAKVQVFDQFLQKLNSL